MAEYISRDAAFDAVFGQFCASSDETEAALNAAIEEIRAIPAADVRPVVRGGWQAADFHTVTCSACGFAVDVMKADSHLLNHMNFCPNCGADMREVDDAL